MPTSRHGLYSPASNAGYAPFHRASDRPASLLSHLFSRPVLIILALLALGAAALSLLPTLPIRLNAPAETTQDGTREDGAHAPASGMVVEAVSEHSDSPLAAQPPLQPELPASSTPALSAPAAAPEATPAAAETAPVAPQPAVPFIAFAATQSTWVSVRDAKGKNLLDRTLKAGEQASVTEGELPLAVKIGKVDGVSVTVRGEPFDAKALARGSVARFEVK